MPENIQVGENIRVAVDDGILEQIQQVEPIHFEPLRAEAIEAAIRNLDNEIRNRGEWVVDEAFDNSYEIKMRNENYEEMLLKTYLSRTHHTCQGLLAFGLPDDALKTGITKEIVLRYIEKYENNQ